jgi:hypothetical protein
MLEFQLFRVKVFFPAQLPLLERPPSRQEILKQAIESLPSAESRRGLVWHIGNVAPVDRTGLYLRLGRTTTTTVEVFEDGRFRDQTFETAPYTHALIDLDLEVCAIAKKTRLSPTIKGIANQFARLLQESRRAMEFQITFEISELADPEDFISHLRTAYAISKFTVWFSQPNPFDVNEDFIGPAQRLVRESNSHQGKTELKGDNLNSDVLTDITRSAASTGDDAVAWLKPSQRQRRVKKRLKGSSVNVPQQHVDDLPARQTLLDKVRDLYRRIRQGGGRV